MTEDLRQEGLVGRDRELRSIGSALASNAPCIVHVTGAPGSGKSALALTAAKAHGSATIVRLAGARGESGLREALAAHGEAGTLEAFLAQVTTDLVVLDGADDLIDHVRRALDVYFARGARASVLVTSSNDLDLDDVRLLVVATPLDLESSRELFLRCARRARAGVSTAIDVEADLVTMLLERLEGSPLAIASAASRLGVFDLAELVKRVESDAAAALAETPLVASLSRAVSRLAGSTRLALVEASSFESSFTASEAESVLSSEAGPVVVHLEELVKRGFLHRQSSEHGLRLHTSFVLRAFVRDTSGELSSALAEARVRQARQVARRVADRALGNGAFGRGLEVRDCLAAAFVLEQSGSPKGALDVLFAVEVLAPTELVDPRPCALLDTLVASAKSSREPQMEGRALLLRGRVAQFVGRADDALADVEKALERAKKAKDPLLEGLVLQRLGSLRSDRGQAQDAVTLLTRSIALLEPRSWRGTVAALSTLGTAEMAIGESTSARKRFLDALALREKHEDAEGAGQEHSGIGATLFQEGRLDEAVVSFDRARDLLVRTGPRDILGYALAARAMTLQELGRFEEAESDLVRALGELENAKNRRFWRVFCGYLAQAQHEARAFERAESSYRGAIAALKADGHVAYEVLFTASYAALLASFGRLDEAEPLVRGELELESAGRAGKRLSRKEPHAIAAAVHVGHYFLAKAKASTESEGASASLAKAKARLLLAADARTDDDVRFAERLLARAISAFESTTEREVLHVGKDTSSFRLGARAEVDLRRKRATRLMMRALVDKRIGAPGELLSVDALVQATWPGERILPHAALSRAYVTVLMLRNLGLRSVLLQREGGYYLDPSVEIVVES